MFGESKGRDESQRTFRLLPFDSVMLRWKSCRERSWREGTRGRCCELPGGTRWSPLVVKRGSLQPRPGSAASALCPSGKMSAFQVTWSIDGS